MSFITIDKLNGSSGETISTITVPEYQGLEDRTQSFKVVVDGKEVFVNVQQKAFKPSLTTNKQVVAFTQDVITQSLQITSNFNWEARTDSSWFTLSQTEGNKGTTTIEISTSSIESPSENRNGTINFYFGNTFVTAITIKQEFEIIFEVEKLIDVTYGQELKIKSNILWNATVNDSDWFTISPFSGVSGVTTMNIILLDELEDVSRSGKIKFYYDSILLEEVSVVQYTEGVPFYIEPIDSNVEIGLKDGTILYSYDVEGVWQELNTNSTIVINQKVFFKEWKHYNSIGAFNIQGKCNVGGDITNVCGRTMKRYYASYLFDNCDIVDASNLILPFKTLGKNAYENMFWRCKYLTTAPKLVATKLDSFCYYMMFSDCTSLLVAPELPSTNIATGCYSYMFEGCTSLLIAPELPATILTDDCYEGMFQGCTSLYKTPALRYDTIVDDEDVTGSRISCFEYMFKDCTSLRRAILYFDSVNTSFCQQMFQGCEKLNYIYTTAIEIDSLNWVDGVSIIGTFVKGGFSYKDARGADYIPELWELKYVDEVNIDYTYFSEQVIDLSDDLTQELMVISDTDSYWTISVEAGVDWLTFSSYSGKGDTTINVTAKDYINQDRTAKVYLYANGTLVNTLEVNQVYVPSDCFYIEKKEGYDNPRVSLSNGTTVINDATVLCYNKDLKKWYNLNTLTYTDKDIYRITLNQKTYFKNYIILDTSNYNYRVLNIDGLPIIGGNIETLLGEMKENYALRLFEHSNISDASNLILPSATLSENCYNSMFFYCEDLKKAPTLSATTLSTGCYKYMFAYCRKLNNITMLATDISANDCLDMWVYNVSSNGTFTKKQGVEIPSGDDGIPDGWTVVELS